MKQKKVLLTLLLSLSLFAFASADIQVYEFYSATCPHCANVKASGILDKVDASDDVSAQTYEISTPGGYQKYEYYHDRISMSPGVPLVVIECENGAYQHIIGDTPIINGLEGAVENCRTGNIPSGKDYTFLYITIAAVVIAVLYFYLTKKKKK